MAVTLNASTSSGFVQSADTSGEINLQSNGSTKLTVASTGVSGTIVQGTAVASTSGTSIDFTGIPSWAKTIRILFNGISTTGSSNLIVQIGSGSVTTSGYASQAWAATGSGINTAGFILTNGNAASNTIVSTILLTNITSNTWVSSALLNVNNATSVGFQSVGNSPNLSGALDRVRITTVGGTDTFDAGTINIQYEG